MPRKKAHRANTAKPRNGSISPPRAALADWFGAFAQGTARLAGKPAIFLTAVLVVLVWGVTGPLFNFSDTWQLVINTGTTIVTFLMVFLIQNTQNRDALAVQLKLAELIVAMKGVPNRFAVVEDLSDEELDTLHSELRTRADETLEHLNQRRGAGQKSKKAVGSGNA